MESGRLWLLRFHCALFGGGVFKALVTGGFGDVSMGADSETPAACQ
jgi:hypothetical protein